jgi:hypothetical protein
LIGLVPIIFRVLFDNLSLPLPFHEGDEAFSLATDIQIGSAHIEANAESRADVAVHLFDRTQIDLRRASHPKRTLSEHRWGHVPGELCGALLVVSPLPRL